MSYRPRVNEDYQPGDQPRKAPAAPASPGPGAARPRFRDPDYADRREDYHDEPGR